MFQIPTAYDADAVKGDAERLALHEASHLRTAAVHARRVYPGRVGELIARELLAHAEFGYRFSTDSLIPRLAREILAQPARTDAA